MVDDMVGSADALRAANERIRSFVVNCFILVLFRVTIYEMNFIQVMTCLGDMTLSGETSSAWDLTCFANTRLEN